MPLPVFTNYYSQCKKALLLKVRTDLVTYFPKNYQVGSDDTVLGQQGNYFFIARTGEFPSKQLGGSRQYDFNWHTDCEVYMQFKKFKTSPDDFDMFRSDVINDLMSDPLLNGTPNVWHVMVSSNQKVQYLKFAEEDTEPAFIFQTLDVTISQRINYSQGVKV